MCMCWLHYLCHTADLAYIYKEYLFLVNHLPCSEILIYNTGWHICHANKKMANANFICCKKRSGELIKFPLTFFMLRILSEKEHHCSLCTLCNSVNWRNIHQHCVHICCNIPVPFEYIFFFDSAGTVHGCLVIPPLACVQCTQLLRTREIHSPSIFLL